MTTIAFPTSLYLSRDSTFTHNNNTRVDFLSSGESRSRVLSSTQYVTIQCVFKSLDSDEKATLENFLIANCASDITWTIDDIDYIGVVVGGHQVSMTGARYNVSFTYYAKKA